MDAAPTGTTIHPSSIIGSEVELGANVSIGPNCQIMGKTQIGDGCVVDANVHIGSKFGLVEIGKENKFYSYSYIGGPPQDITYKDAETKLIIGDRNTFREFGTMNIATSKGDGGTFIGNDNYFMTYTHVGHDCRVGNHIIIANSTNLGGHVCIEDHVKIGGACHFNQFVRVGRYAFIAGVSVIIKDILPFSSSSGHPCVVRATNKIGLERGGFSDSDIDRIHTCMRALLKGSSTQAQIIEEWEKNYQDSEHIMYLVRFIKSSTRGIAK